MAEAAEAMKKREVLLSKGDHDDALLFTVAIRATLERERPRGEVCWSR